MQGEHVVELASLIGVDMAGLVRSGAGVDGLDVPVTVLHKPDTWKDQPVDVDYPAQAGVARPKGTNVKMFKAWSADQLTTFVCPLVKSDLGGSKIIPEKYCARRHHDTIDPTTGK